MEQEEARRREYRALEDTLVATKGDLARARACEDDIVAQLQEVVRKNKALTEEVLELRKAKPQDGGWFSRKSK